MRSAYDLARVLLDQTIAALEAVDEEINLPETRYVAPGTTVAYDGEQVTTNVTDVTSGNPGQQTPYELGSFQFFSVHMLFVIVRFTPTIDDEHPLAPDPDDLDASARQMLGDVTALAQAFVIVRESGVLVPPSLPSSWTITSDGPQGGVVGVVGNVVVPLL